MLSIHKGGETPLHLAEENLNICKFLLENGANIHQKDYEKRTVILGASSTPNNLEVVKLFISYGADVNTQDTYGNTPLHEASLNDDTLDNIKFLIENHADIHIKNNELETPLDRAIAQENMEVKKYLLSIEALEDDNFTQ